MGMWGQCSRVMLHVRLSQGTLDVYNGKYIHKEKTMKMKARGQSQEGC